jgi:ribosomal protein L11 methyltransferase
MAATYWTVAVPLPGDGPEAGEALTNFLWETGAVGVVEEAAPAASPSRLLAFFPPGREPGALRRAVAEYLDALGGLGLRVDAGGLRVEALPEAPWAEAWRAHFRPLAVGGRWLVCPPWEVPAAPPAGPAGPRTVVVIEPGRAFGTGGHASTQGCLELLERVLAGGRPARVLDVGTGSGILAVAAALAGVARVEAFDPDPDAVAAAGANAARNGVAGRVRVAAGDFATWPGPPAPLVLANLLGATHVAGAAALARLVAPAGRLVAGGLLAGEAAAVGAAFAPAGLRPETTVEREGWAALLLARGA